MYIYIHIYIQFIHVIIWYAHIYLYISKALSVISLPSKFLGRFRLLSDSCGSMTAALQLHRSSASVPRSAGGSQPLDWTQLAAGCWDQNLLGWRGLWLLRTVAFHRWRLVLRPLFPPRIMASMLSSSAATVSIGSRVNSCSWARLASRKRGFWS